MSEDQKYCIQFLATFAGGYHHLPTVHQFGTGVCVNFTGDLSTHDFNRLTMLVLLAHRYAVRVEIASSGPGMVKIIAHRRKHGVRKNLRSFEYHPNLEELRAMSREVELFPEINTQHT
jgi:hypothetical protein